MSRMPQFASYRRQLFGEMVKYYNSTLLQEEREIQRRGQWQGTVAGAVAGDSGRGTGAGAQGYHLICFKRQACSYQKSPVCAARQSSSSETSQGLS